MMTSDFSCCSVSRFVLFLRAMNPLRIAIQHLGSQARLARALNVRQSAVANWLSRGTPAERCRQIEDVTGGVVSRYDLRPDVFGASPEDRAA